MILPSGLIINWSNVDCVEVKGKRYILHMQNTSIYIEEQDYQYLKTALKND
jgi:hypothetical protein